MEQNITAPYAEGAIVPFEPNWDEDTADFNLMEIVSELENGKLAQIAQPINTVSKSLMQQCNSPLFTGCKIGNITINIQKKLS